jgi:hypothetical protein
MLGNRIHHAHYQKRAQALIGILKNQKKRRLLRRLSILVKAGQSVAPNFIGHLAEVISIPDFFIKIPVENVARFTDSTPRPQDKAHM